MVAELGLQSDKYCWVYLQCTWVKQSLNTWFEHDNKYKLLCCTEDAFGHKAGCPGLMEEISDQPPPSKSSKRVAEDELSPVVPSKMRRGDLTYRGSHPPATSQRVTTPVQSRHASLSLPSTQGGSHTCNLSWSPMPSTPQRLYHHLLCYSPSAPEPSPSLSSFVDVDIPCVPSSPAMTPSREATPHRHHTPAVPPVPAASPILAPPTPAAAPAYASPLAPSELFDTGTKKTWPGTLHVCDIVQGFRIVDNRVKRLETIQYAFHRAFGGDFIFKETTYREHHRTWKCITEEELHEYCGYGRTDQGLWMTLRRTVQKRLKS